MMTESGRSFTLLLVFILSLSTNGNPLSGHEGEDVQPPFGDCTLHHLGGTKGVPLTEMKNLTLVPELAFYPLTDDDIMLKLQVMFTKIIFKIRIQGTLITLEKCEYHRRNFCTMENEEGVKHPDYLKAYHWNLVFLNLNSHWLEIHIGNRKVMSKSMVDYQTNPKDIMWQVQVDDPPRKTLLASDPKFLYLVQFKCLDYQTRKEGVHAPSVLVPHYRRHDGGHINGHFNSEESNEHLFINDHDARPTTPITFRPFHFSVDPQPVTAAPQTGSSTPAAKKERKESRYVGLIVGLVVAVLIIVALVIVIYNVMKKRRSMNLNESSPLNKDQQQQQQQQQVKK